MDESTQGCYYIPSPVSRLLLALSALYSSKRGSESNNTKRKEKEIAYRYRKSQSTNQKRKKKKESDGLRGWLPLRAGFQSTKDNGFSSNARHRTARNRDRSIFAPLSSIRRSPVLLILKLFILDHMVFQHSISFDFLLSADWFGRSFIFIWLPHNTFHVISLINRTNAFNTWRLVASL